MTDGAIVAVCLRKIVIAAMAAVNVNHRWADGINKRTSFGNHLFESRLNKIQAT
jgi:hypothetical protein